MPMKTDEKLKKKPYLMLNLTNTCVHIYPRIHISTWKTFVIKQTSVVHDFILLFWISNKVI